MSAADRWSAVLVCAATLYAAFTFGRLGEGVFACVAAVGGLGVLLVQRALWTRRGRLGRARLVRGADGQLWHEGNGRTLPVEPGVAARLLGPSVFLDLHSAEAGVRWHYRGWLTPFDLHRETLRRWNVVLPRAGRRGGT